jgi:hypothetical protein
VSGRTWLMMLLILGLNWGGFLLALAYGLRREGKTRALNKDEN